MSRYTLFLSLCLLPLASLSAQNWRFLEPADSLDPGRFWTCAGIGAGLYTGASIGLYHAWYKGHELTGFHTFDDWGEWKDMDKAGHILSAYAEAALSFRGARWTGLDRRKSLWVATGVSLLIQSTIEVMDGFSAKWGFSWYDMGANLVGTGAFVGQELAWQEQRILFKASNHGYNYPDHLVYPVGGGPPMSLRQRADELYGSTYAEIFLKDYNALRVWASVNPHAFLSGSKPGWLPPWLNIAVGYSGGNLYGGFENAWDGPNGERYVLDPTLFPRHRQFYLSLDADLSRIPTRSNVLRTVFHLLNWVKVPAPALEFNSLGRFRAHPLLW
jgi:hypothetical protein